MSKKFKYDNLIETYSALDEFAKHFETKGAVEVHRLIYEKFIEARKNQCIEGTPIGLARNGGYESAIIDVLKEIRANYIK